MDENVKKVIEIIEFHRDRASEDKRNTQGYDFWCNEGKESVCNRVLNEIALLEQPAAPPEPGEFVKKVYDQFPTLKEEAQKFQIVGGSPNILTLLEQACDIIDRLQADKAGRLAAKRTSLK